MTTLILVATSSATTYRFREPAPLGGWACCTVNDDTGELNITSDWGNWGHRWNVDHLGTPTLTDFLAGGSLDYLAGKLLGKDTWEFDEEATVRDLHRILIKRRRAQLVDRDTARYVWDQIECHGNDCGGNSIVFFERITSDEIVNRHLGDEPWEHGRERHTNAFKVLVGTVLPALCAACRARTEKAAVG